MSINNINRIGIWISVSNLNNNGAKNYFESSFDIFKNHKFNNVEIKFISNHVHEIENIIYFNPNFALFIYKIFILFSRLSKYSILFSFFSKKLLNFYLHLIKKISNEVDILYYLTPTENIIPDFPYVYTLWDLGHLSTYPFPELAMYYSFENRMNFYKNILQKSLMIFTESNEGKFQLINYLKIFPDKISVLPMISSNIIKDDIIPQKPLNFINKQFIHYPAHFWAHKNHYNLILAFNEVIKVYPDIILILFGEDKGTKKKIHDLIFELKLERHILLYERFQINELKWIFLNSVGLVYPSFLGPTNMPIIEAYELNCNISCSNLPGHYEQVGNYANYFDPKNFNEIAISILNMISKQSEINKKTFKLNSKEEFILKFEESIMNIFSIKNTW